MQKFTKNEIDDIAQGVFATWVAVYSLRYAKKIATGVKRLLLAEEKRRRGLK